MPTLSDRLINPLVATDQEFLNNPYPHLARLRTEAPVWWCAEQKYWLVSRYQDVQSVLKDNTFEKQIHKWKHAPNGFVANLIPSLKFLRQTVSNWLLNLNPPAHTRVRNLVGKAFTPSSIQSLTPKIEELALTLTEHLVISLSAGDPVDLIPAFAHPFPLGVIGLILGIPVDDAGKLRSWSRQVVGVVGGNRDFKRLTSAGSAMKQFAEYLTPHIEQRRKQPTDDLLSILVQAEEDGNRLSTEELVASSILLLIAGFETTVNLISNSVYCLNRYPTQAEIFKQNLQNADAVVREVLRFESPAQTAPRLASRDTVLGGQNVKKGDMVWLLLGSANRDAEKFSDPDRFDISRPGERNLAFGDGIHRCLGAGLAEVEAAVALKVLFNRIPDLHTLEPVNFQAPFGLRGPKELLVASR
ncbi:MAG TPA: cytochrome P450 [Drouetiella sp.]|jgi:cytochrome P450